MEPNAENYNPSHYAVRNREDLGRALPGDTLELTAEKFREELDVYDKEKWLQLSSIRVPQPYEHQEDNRSEENGSGENP